MEGRRRRPRLWGNRMNPLGHFLQKLAGLGGRLAKELYHTELIAQLQMNASLEEIH